MLGLLYRFIIGHFQSCQHTMQTIEEFAITDSFGRDKGKMYVQKCSKCGMIQGTKVMA